MLSDKAYLQKLEARTIELLEGSADMTADMSQLAEAATEGGLIFDEGVVRYDNSWQFATDLFTGNPLAGDMMGAKRIFERLPDPPSGFESIDEIASAMRPSRSD